MASSSDESLANSDEEEMICCDVCLYRFNDSDRKPKFLDCHHFFCFPCIKGFSKGNRLSCPTCRFVTNMTGRKIEELSTNQTALQLVAITLSRAKEKKNSKGVYSEPIENNKPDYKDLLQSRAEGCCQMWDRAIEDRQKVQIVYGDVLESLRALQAEILRRIDANDGQVAVMESQKHEAMDLALAEGAKAAEDSIGQIIAKFDKWDMDANRHQLIAQRLLQNFNSIQETCIELIFSSIYPDKAHPLRHIELLGKKLQLSFSGTRYDKEPALKACVSVLSFLILRLDEEQGKAGGKNGVKQDKNRQRQEIPKGNAGNLNIPQVVSAIRDNVAIDSDKESCDDASSIASGNATKHQDTRYDLSRPPPPVPAGQDWQLVSSKTPATNGANKTTNSEGQAVPRTVKVPAGPNKCYFRFTINGIKTGRVVFLLDRAAAPVMSARFVEMCTSPTGYQGSLIFKNYRAVLVMGGSRFFYTKDQPRKDIFTADASGIVEKRGSIFFQAKNVEPPKIDVSTEFQIILVNRAPHQKSNTVFGQIVEGLEICDKISELNVKEHRVVIAECGTLNVG